MRKFISYDEYLQRKKPPRERVRPPRVTAYPSGSTYPTTVRTATTGVHVPTESPPSMQSVGETYADAAYEERQTQSLSGADADTFSAYDDGTPSTQTLHGTDAPLWDNGAPLETASEEIATENARDSLPSLEQCLLDSPRTRYAPRTDVDADAYRFTEADETIAAQAQNHAFARVDASMLHAPTTIEYTPTQSPYAPPTVGYALTQSPYAPSTVEYTQTQSPYTVYAEESSTHSAVASSAPNADENGAQQPVATHRAPDPSHIVEYVGTAVERAPDPPVHKKRRAKGVMSLMFMCVCFALAIVSAVFLSNGLSLAHLAGKKERLYFDAMTYFAVETGASADRVEAEEMARSAREKGGGGYVSLNNGLYSVFVSVYEREADADSVIKNLSQGGTTAAKHRIEIPSVYLDVETDKKTESVIRAAMEQFPTAFRALYAAGNAFDIGELKSAAARLKAFDALKSMRACAESFAAVTQAKTNLIYIHIKAELNSVLLDVETLALDADNETTVSQDFKYLTIKIAYAHARLASELAG